MFERIKQRILESQWPKIHRHSKTEIIEISKEDWEKLPLAKRSHSKDDFCTLEYRDCSCGSTLAVMTEIHDLSAE